MTATPGDIGTEPRNQLVFNAPFDSPVTVALRITNKGGKRIGWTIRATSKRMKTEPQCGVINPKEKNSVCVTCFPFDFEAEETGNDRVIIEWVDCPTGAGADKKFQMIWFETARITRRHVMICGYNIYGNEKISNVL